MEIWKINIVWSLFIIVIFLYLCRECVVSKGIYVVLVGKCDIFRINKIINVELIFFKINMFIVMNN